MKNQHGFKLINDAHIQELNTRALRYRHIRTGAQLLSLVNDDENKVFGITFRTPPADSTGLPHILEHAVLGGSHKYPLKEPFVQLIKSSLNTYLNAVTYPDKTAYPVASTNLKDFYNLVNVYLDAVFHPLITPHHLQQEGWHYELDDSGAPLTYKGVVFNEMKGAYSSPDTLMYRHSAAALLPDTIYRHDSGGDPAVIPTLTYQQFKRFHETYYHPSNARIYFYGNDNPAERLRLLDDTLSAFPSKKRLKRLDAAIPLQPAFTAPRRVVHSYGVDGNGDNDHKAMIRLHWLLPEAVDPTFEMGLSVLGHAIIGTQASPLRKALVDSGLGEDVSGGMSGDIRQLTFAAGMKNIASEDADKVEALILETLSKLEQEGIDPEMVEAALNSIEFSLRENNTGSYPRGLALMFSALGSWLYDRDPLDGIRYETPLAAVRSQVVSNPRYFQEMIRKHLLENQHRVTVLLTPDPEYNQRLEATERARLHAVEAQLNASERQAIIENTQELKRLQAIVDTPEALATLPTLTLDDLERQNKRIPLSTASLGDAQVIYHDLFTNGIAYFNFGWDLRAAPLELLPYVKLFGQSLTEMGTESEDYVKLSQRILRKTGGVYASTFVGARQQSQENSAWFLLNGKATVAHTPDLLGIMRDVLLTVKLDNRERFRQIVLKSKARAESALIPSGHTVVDSRLRAGFSTASWVSEQLGGIDYLFFLRSLSEQIDNNWPAVLANLEAVRSHLLSRQTMLCNVTLDSDNWQKLMPTVAEFIDSLPATSHTINGWAPTPLPNNEGLTIPAQVNYVGKGANLYELGYQHHGSINVISNFLRTGYLWDKVRVQGGAYGGMCRFGKQSGVFTYLSYRDPNLLATLDVYDQTASYLRTVEIDQDELERNIIGSIGDFDAYMLPDAKGYTSFTRYLIGESDENLQRTREEMLATSTAHFRAFADVLDAVARQGRVVVLGAAEAVEKASAERQGWLTLTKVM